MASEGSPAGGRGCLLIAQSPEIFTAMGTPGLSGGPSK
jgi:hypothetical protein